MVFSVKFICWSSLAARTAAGSVLSIHVRRFGGTGGSGGGDGGGGDGGGGGGMGGGAGGPGGTGGSGPLSTELTQQVS